MHGPSTSADNYLLRALEAEQGPDREALVDLACEWLTKARPHGVALVLDDAEEASSLPLDSIALSRI